jgi:hypothetical protein
VKPCVSLSKELAIGDCWMAEKVKKNMAITAGCKA